MTNFERLVIRALMLLIRAMVASGRLRNDDFNESFHWTDDAGRMLDADVAARKSAERNRDDTTKG